MPTKTLTIVRGATVEPCADETRDVVAFSDFRQDLLRGRLGRYLGRYSSAEMHTARIEALTKPLNCAVLLRLASRGDCWFTDDCGNRRRIGLGDVAQLAGRWFYDLVRIPGFIGRYRRRVQRLGRQCPRARPGLDLSRRPAYLRADLCFGLRSGGSVGHIAGVLNNLRHFGGEPVFVTTDRIPTVAADIETHTVLPDGSFFSFGELPLVYFTDVFTARVRQHLNVEQPSFLYQRYALDNFSGVELARQLAVPLVLEYNGSEVWCNRHWGRPLKYESLALDIEELNVRAADLVVVVSEPLRKELVDRGVDAGRILVNPNGVDPHVYRPEIDGSAVRRRYRLDGKTVIGFIGTFGKWHGAEVLAEAFGRLVWAHPEYRESLRLLLIGDGAMMPQVREQLASYHVEDCTALTGLVPQADGPGHLAACDILVAPHVPNPDGTPFFGSPTKLFEYMAMGKAIVASDLDQIGQVLEHGCTAWVVPPGNVDALKEGLRHVVDAPSLGRQMAAAARKEVVSKYTWLKHTQRIVDALRDRCGPATHGSAGDRALDKAA